MQKMIDYIIRYFSVFQVRRIVMIFLLAGVVLSCTRNSEDNCPGTKIETVSIEDLEYLRFKDVDEEKKEVNFVIRSKSEYDKYVISTHERPEIDFSKYALLCGRIKYNKCHFLERKEVVDRCGILEHRVYVGERLCGALTTIYYFTVVPAEYTQKTGIDFVEIPYN